MLIINFILIRPISLLQKYHSVSQKPSIFVLKVTNSICSIIRITFCFGRYPNLCHSRTNISWTIIIAWPRGTFLGSKRMNRNSARFKKKHVKVCCLSIYLTKIWIRNFGKASLRIPNIFYYLHGCTALEFHANSINSYRLTTLGTRQTMTRCITNR